MLICNNKKVELRGSELIISARPQMPQNKKPLDCFPLRIQKLTIHTKKQKEGRCITLGQQTAKC